MIKFRIHGRGGQGGVTLAKILAFMYWTEGKWVQAFGDYSAERTGSPILAFTLIDDIEITNRSKVYYPDHLIVLDSTLINDTILAGLQPGGFIIIDSPYSPKYFSEFTGYRVATINAKKIALKHKLGTKTTPITNSTMVGALAKVFRINFSTVEKTIRALHFPEENIQAARDAYNAVLMSEVIPGKPKIVEIQVTAVPVPPLITGNLGAEPPLNTGDWKSEEPFYTQNHIAPCNFNCPAGNYIREFIQELTQGNYDGALSVLKRTTPLPGSTARVCPHPCEDYCNRKDFDEQVNIHALERLSADKGKIKPIKPEIERKGKVAIIGSGPAGLTAAYHLRRYGYQPEIFEALPKPGGMMQYGIPEFRLPKKILNDEIQFIIDSGVKITCNTAIKTPADFERLTKKYAAVIIAIGLSFGREDTRIPGSTPDSVMQGIDFLRRINSGENVYLGEKVIVIGGGNTAVDVSRTALRLGAQEVTIVYRRSREEMPAIPEEIEEALAEGVHIKYLYAPVEMIQNKKTKRLKVQRMRLGDPGEDGRRKPIPVPDAYETIECNTVVLATGQGANLSFLEGKDIPVKNGFITANYYGITKNKKVFAAGDIVTNDGTVIHAIGQGRRAADAVHRFFGGRVSFAKKKIGKIVSAQQLNLYYFAPTPRKETDQLSPKKRIKSFKEVNIGLKDIEEALRCFSCGLCNGCITDGVSKCELFCPERTIKKVTATRLEINYEGCKGCLICIEVCPRNAMDKRIVKKLETVQ